MRVQWFMHDGGSEVFVGILVVKLKAAEAMAAVGRKQPTASGGGVPEDCQLSYGR